MRNITCRRWTIVAGTLILAACGGGDSTSPAVNNPLPPVIVSQPTSLFTTVGSNVFLAVTVTGSIPITIQWHHDGAAIAGAINDTLFIPLVTEADSGKYFVTATNTAGKATSDTVSITLKPVVSSTAWRQQGGAATSLERTYASTLADESAIYVTAAGLLTASIPVVTKSGAPTDLAASRASGVNAAIRSEAGSRIYITGGSVRTDSAGTTALFATGTGSRLTLTNGSVTTNHALSPAIGASNGGSVEITGGSLTAAGDLIAVAAQAGGEATALVSITGGTTVSAGSGVLMSVTGGAKASLSLSGVTIAGNIATDATSTVTVSLSSATSWTGRVNVGAVTLDAGSTWTVTGASLVTVLSGATIVGTTITNIIGNGNTVSYDAALPGNAIFAGGTFTLASGGALVPR